MNLKKAPRIIFALAVIVITASMKDAFIKDVRGNSTATQRKKPTEPIRGWCCLDGQVYPVGASCCQELGGRFFRTREEAERFCKPKLPDLIAQELVVSPKRLYVGEEVAVRATVRNMGQRPAGRIEILFRARLGQKEYEIARETVGFLEAGQGKDVLTRATARESGDWLITVRIDPENRIREWEENNNDAAGLCLVDSPITSVSPVSPEDMFIADREVEALAPQPRGVPDPSFLRREDKEPDARFERLSIKYDATYSIEPQSEKSLPFEITVPAVVLIRVFIHEGQPEDLSILLFREGHDQPVWSKNGPGPGEPQGIISEIIDITPEMVVQEKNWTLILMNKANQTLKAEVSAGIIDRQ